jgi:hypothetical protein
MLARDSVTPGAHIHAEPCERAFHHLPGSDASPDELRRAVSEWIARVYRVGKLYRVVVEGLLQFEVDHLEGVEDQTASAILERLRMAYPTRAKPWADSTAERVMEFEVAVRPVGQQHHIRNPADAASSISSPDVQGP